MALRETGRVHVKRFNAEAFTYELTTTSPENITRALETIVNGNDMIGVEINHSALDKRIIVPFSQNMSSENIINLIERVQQSQRGLSFDDKLILKFVKVYK